MRGWFVSGTGTGVGKTFVTAALTRALRGDGVRVLALKPAETGVATEPEDAVLLAEASGFPEVAQAAGFYRVPPPLSPYAAGLSGHPLPPAPGDLARTIATLAQHHRADFTLVEGAGGLLVPMDAAHTMADLAKALRLPVLLVALDALGTLSHTLTAYESAERRGLTVAAVFVNHPPSITPDGTEHTNARILRERIAAPVLTALPELIALAKAAF